MPRQFTIHRSLFILYCLLCLCGAVRAQEGTAVSTMPARQQKEESPLLLNIVKDGRDSRIGLDYSIRWDFSDLAHIRPGLKTLSEGIAAIRNWDITENTRVKYYGFRTNPWRIFLSREKIVPAQEGGGSQFTRAGAGAPVYKKRLRLSFSPLVDDLKRGLDENLRNALLQNSLKAAGPQWQKTNTRDKKIFFNDVLSLEIWKTPGLDATKKGLQYISQ
jgi:hypothetical protein